MAQASEDSVEVYQLRVAAESFRNAFACLGVSLPRGTPERLARAWAEMLKGYHEDWRQHVKLFDLQGAPDADEPAVISLDGERGHRRIELSCSFVSVCEHHVLPFEGECIVRYEPGRGGILGASKVIRMVRSLAARLQIQERLTEDIACAIAEATHAKWVQVETTATHACMRCRGVREGSSMMRCVATLPTLATPCNS